MNKSIVTAAQSNRLFVVEIEKVFVLAHACVTDLKVIAIQDAAVSAIGTVSAVIAARKFRASLRAVTPSMATARSLPNHAWQNCVKIGN